VLVGFSDTVHNRRAKLVKLESETPRPVDMNRVSQRLATQRVEVEARKVHFLRRLNDTKTIKAQQDALMHLQIDLRRLAVQPQFGSALFLNVLITQPPLRDIGL
jgi:hypothetical protein